MIQIRATLFSFIFTTRYYPEEANEFHDHVINPVENAKAPHRKAASFLTMDFYIYMYIKKRERQREREMDT